VAAAFTDLTTITAVLNMLGIAPGTTEPSGVTTSALIQTEITNLSQYILTRTGRTYLGGFLNYAERYNGNGSQRLALRNYPILAVSALSIGGTAIPPSPDFRQSGFVIDTSGSQCFLAIVPECSTWNTGGYQPWRGYGNAPPLSGNPYSFWEGIQNIAVNYTAGPVTTAYYESHAIPNSPGPYTVAVTNQASFWADEGVTQGGIAVTGYTVAAGVYTFPASMAGQNVLITYQYGAVPYDLNEAVTKIVATYYRRPSYLDQSSVTQPGVGTTAYSRAEWAPECESIITKYKRVFLD